MTILLIIFLGCFMFSCNIREETRDTRKADEDDIRQADIEWAKTGVAKDLNAMMEFYSEDPILMAPNRPQLRGKENIRAFFESLYSQSDFSVTWRPVTVEVARSGDIGYVIGIYEMNTDTGKYIEIWKKQDDGNWKVALDILNSDLPSLQTFDTLANK